MLTSSVSIWCVFMQLRARKEAIAKLAALGLAMLGSVC